MNQTISRAAANHKVAVNSRLVLNGIYKAGNVLTMYPGSDIRYAIYMKDARFVNLAIVGVRGYPSFYGGFETAVRHLVPFLLNLELQVTVYSRESKDNHSDQTTRLKVIRTWGLNTKKFSTLTHGFSAMLHAAVSKPDIVLILNVANCIWIPFLRLRRIPTVVNVDGIEWKRQKWGPIARLTFFLGAKLAARYASSLIYDSVNIEKYWFERFGRRGTYIPYGGDFQVYPSLKDDFKDPYLLVVSRLVPENSIDVFLDAAPKIQSFVAIVIVGNSSSTSSYPSKILALSSQFPKIKWLGQVSDDHFLKSLWQHCAVYFHGHTVGGTNPALVQAMASGAPILAIDSEFNHEVLGDSGIFTPPKADAIVQAVHELISDKSLAQEIGQGARQRALGRFTWEKVNLQYLTLLNDTFMRENRL
jgi:glycosyltransferase involved in cell wall biosynthesis